MFCRGAEDPTGMWADHRSMDVEDVIAAEKIGAVEVQTLTTRGPPAVAFQGAHDVVGHGARRNEERSTTESGVKLPQTI